MAALQASAVAPFYVVSSGKFLLLFIATLGAYQLYWFYAHWHRYRQRRHQNVSPFWRAAFGIFFIHKLFDAFTKPEPTSEVARGPGASSGQLGGMATLYVVLMVAGRIVDRVVPHYLSEVPKDRFTWTDHVSLLLMLGCGYPLFIGQKVANASSGDPSGASNARLTGLNYVFVVLGGLIWLLMLVGILAGPE